MSTFLELQNEVLAHGFDANQYRARVKTYLNIAQQRIARSVEIRELFNDTTLTTAAGTQAYTLPSDLIRFVSLFVANDRLIDPVEPWQIDAASSATGAPLVYTITNDGLLLYPTPDTVYTLSLRYYKEPTTLSADGDVPQIPSDYHDVLVSFALSRAYRSEDDAEMSAFFMNEYQRDLLKLGADRQYEIQDGPKQVGGTWAAPHPQQGYW